MPAKGNFLLASDDDNSSNTTVPSVTAAPLPSAAAAAINSQLPALAPPPAPSEHIAAAAVTVTPPPPACIKEMDHLVQEIKENLKLGHHLYKPAAPTSSFSGPLKASRRSKAHARASPYAVPPSSRASGCDNNNGDRGGNAEGGPATGPSQLRRWNHRRRYPSTCKADNEDVHPSDPFAMLQELITDGSLIKEAVRRLQLGLTPKYNAAAAAEDAAASKQQRDFYDSDEDCRTPPAYPDLVCGVWAAAGHCGGGWRRLDSS